MYSTLSGKISSAPVPLHTDTEKNNSGHCDFQAWFGSYSEFWHFLSLCDSPSDFRTLMQYLIKPAREKVFNLGQQNFVSTCTRHTQIHRKDCILLRLSGMIQLNYLEGSISMSHTVPDSSVSWWPGPRYWGWWPHLPDISVSWWPGPWCSGWWPSSPDSLLAGD
jgi:hypothetical protein